MEQDLINVKHAKKEEVLYEEGHSFYMACGLPWKKIKWLQTGLAEFSDDNKVGLTFTDPIFWQYLKNDSVGVFWEGQNIIFNFNLKEDFYYGTPLIPTNVEAQIKNDGEFHAVLFDNEDNVIDQFTVADVLCVDNKKNFLTKN